MKKDIAARSRWLVWWSFPVSLAVSCAGLAMQSPPAAPPATQAPAAAPPNAQPPRVVMVRVGKDEITVQDFMGYLQGNSNRIKAALTPEGKARVLRAMVSDRLIRDEIIRQGLVPKQQQNDDQAMLKGYRDLAERQFPRPAKPTEAEAKAFYEQHRAEYGIPPMRRISQIEFRFPKGGEPDIKKAALQKAEAALKRLEQGEAFAKVAAELTENRDARERGGDLGFLPRNWLRDEVRDLELGRRTGIVETPTAYEIMLATEDRPALLSTFEEVKARVEQRIQDEQQDRLKTAYVIELSRKTPVTVVMDELKPQFEGGFFPAQEGTPPTP